MIFQERISFATPGRGFLSITSAIQNLVKKSQIARGICQLFIQHTSASLLICENDDPQVQRDLAAFMERLIPDGDPLFKHITEGPDDMPAHIRTIFTETSLGVPIAAGKLALGTWQGLFLWEHRLDPHQRHVLVTVLGE